MVTEINVERLRAGTPAEQSTILKAALNENPQAGQPQLTESLISHIKTGSLSPSVIQIWLGVTREPAVAVTIIQKCRGSLAWQYGVKSLTKFICNETTFKPTWDLIGGAQGLASLMSELSLKDVRALCKALVRTAKSAPDNSPLRTQRQERMSELLLLLSSKDSNPDRRPLHSSYARLAPICTPEVAQEWAQKIEDDEIVDDRGAIVRGLRETLCDVFQQKALEKTFSDNEKLDLKPLKPFCDQNFDFLLVVLQKLFESDSVQKLAPSEFTKFIGPFARRASKLKQKLAPFWKLVNNCLKKHSLLRTQILPVKPLWYRPAGLIAHALKAWRHDSNNGYGDEDLAVLIGFIPKDLCNPALLSDLISQVSPSMRYPLIRLYFKHAAPHRFDLGPPSSTGSAMLSELRLPSILISQLPAVEALTLFERWLEANPSLQFMHNSGWKGYSAIAERYLDPENTINDIHIIRAILLRRTQGQDLILPVNPASILENLKTEELARRKIEATKGQDPGKRGFYAESAFCLSVALGDVKLLTETLVWSRRFLRDSLVVKRVFRSSCFRTDEIEPVITALGASFTNTEDVLAALYQANEFLLCFLETALLALREPSFDRDDWHHPRSLIIRAASNRLRHVNKLQDELKLSDDEVYNAILQPTLDLIIDAETQILKAENERLYPNQHDSNRISIATPELRTTRQPVLRFLDALVKARDDMWLKARVEQNPAVFTLRDPWPRGLTLDFLINDDLQYKLLKVPYVEQRAEAIIFCDPESALASFPGDEETQLAVGTFLEDWTHALEVWIALGKMAGNREDRIRRAWNYALGELSRSRMTREEAERFWGPVFEEADVETELLGIDESLNRRLPTGLPQQPEIPGQPEEWDPDPMLHGFSRKTSKKRVLSETTCLDRMLEPKRRCLEWRGHNGLEGDFEIPFVPAPEPPKEFWKLLPLSKSSIAHSYVDAFIAAAILSLNSTHGSESALLKAPFPNTSDSRFPAVYLEEEFLERTGKSHDGALSILATLNKHVPPKLLETLASSILERIESKKDTSQATYQVFTKVMKLLSQSNEPSLAVPLIARFVLDFPEASSWHRAVLNKGTVSSLDRRAAEDFFSSLCTSFAERLSFKAKSKPFVKITTIKMILELLGNTEYVGPSFSFDVIANKLLRHANHVDVRVKALESLLGVYRENPTKEALDVLRTYAVPMAASLDERQKPMTEADWIALENSDAKLPEVTVRGEATPVLDLLQLSQYSQDFEEIADLAYEAQRLSIGENARWVKLFVKRNGFSLSITTMDILCSVPKFPWHISKTFKSSKDGRVPRDLLQAVARYHQFCLRPPHEIEIIKEVLKKTPQFSVSNAAVRWFELTDPPSHYLNVNLQWALAALNRFVELEDNVDDSLTEFSVTTADLEDYVIGVSKALIAKADVSAFNYVIGSLNPKSDYEIGGIFTDKGAGKVLTCLTEYVDSLRTPEWQSNPDRQPYTLPAILPLRLRSIRYGADSPEEKLPVYIDQILAILSSLVDSTIPYHESYTLLKDKVCTDLKNVRLSGARLIGSVTNFPDPSHPNLLEHLRVQLACDLIRPCLNSLESERRAEADELLIGWKNSSVEDFRNLSRHLNLPKLP